MKPAWIAGVSSFVFAVSACAGKELLDLGGDGGQASHENDGAAAGEGGGSSSGTGGGSGGSSGGSSSGRFTDGGIPIVPGSSFPCGSNVCSAPDVCCEQSGAVAVCQAAGPCVGT